MEVRSEAFTTTTCPHCGERDETERTGDLFRCRCGFEGHADTGASRTFLTNETGVWRIGRAWEPTRRQTPDVVRRRGCRQSLVASRLLS
ncbi:MAG: zinc ribbon domain-containing protein, partial [Halobaculum sp.]